jgi:serine/threonine protein kinase
MIDANNYIGQQFGNYIVAELINSGGFGCVFKAQHIILDDVVAIKIMYSHLGLQQEHARFINEAKLLRKLKTPHILPIIDAGIQNNVPYMVTEYAAGGSLYDHIRQLAGRPFPLDRAIRIIVQVGKALQYAHEQHIVHRDLKPQNILFDANGNALLADFGIAAILETTGTRAVGSGGTPHYMAPEQFDGLVSVKSDQYALGCMTYELVTGRKPYDLEGANGLVAQYQHAKLDPVAPTTYNPLIPSHTEQAILKAMAKDRNNRYSDVATFLAALQKTAGQWFEEGKAYYNLKQYEIALEAYDQVARLEPDDAVAYNNKGAALYHLKQYEAALAACEQAMHLNPHYARIYYLKGYILCDMEKYTEALEALEQAISLDPRGFTDIYDKKKQVHGFLKKQTQ